MQFRRKSRTIEAVLIDREINPLQPPEYLAAELPSTEQPDWLKHAVANGEVVLDIAAGKVRWRVVNVAFAEVGDWLVFVDGQVSRMKPAIFGETYEPVGA